MSLFAQSILDLHDELIVDLFAGGGGASAGIEQALGRQVDIAINHDRAAVEMHKANHPQTQHYVADVFEVDPRMVTQGRSVGFLWASPDCTFHSKARGGVPIRSGVKKRRSLAWVVVRWAGQVSPRVITLENVEEFVKWGPLVGTRDNLRACPKRKGKHFRRFVYLLRELGYAVEWRELRACDYGAPTIRKRLFLIARCDGRPISWPSPTHGDPRSAEVKAGQLKPWRTASECIDWSIPMCSIFATKEEAKAWALQHGVASPIRPLAAKTMQRIARGTKKFVLENPRPYLVNIAHGDGSGDKARWGSGYRDLNDPLSTVTCKGESALVAPFLAGCGGRAGCSPERSADAPLATITGKADSVLCAPHIGTYYGQCDRFHDFGEPLRTQSTENRFSLIASFLGQNNGGFAEGNSGDGQPLSKPLSSITGKGANQSLIGAFLDQANGGFEERVGRSVDEPLSTILTQSRGHHGLIAAHIQRDFGTGVGHGLYEPSRTITSEGGGKCALVASFLQEYYGTGESKAVDAPLGTVTTHDRFGVVTVTIGGETYFVDDIKMRMLTPRELYLCQGFRPGYIIDRRADGLPITKTDQVRMCGNSVSPVVAEAIIVANVPEMIVRRAA